MAHDERGRTARAAACRDRCRSPPGLVAYIDGAPAGWIRVGPRAAQQRILRNRAVEASPEPVDAEDVWAVTCFSVRREHRRKGLNAALLDAAIDYARGRGARVLEAYPIDTTVGKTSTNALYVGSLSTFLAAGFDERARPTATRVLVSRTL